MLKIINFIYILFTEIEFFSCTILVGFLFLILVVEVEVVRMSSRRGITLCLAEWSEILSSGGSKGGRKGRVPPPAQNFFIFMQFSEKIGQIIGWHPPL